MTASEPSPPGSGDLAGIEGDSTDGSESAALGEYTWEAFVREYGGTEAEALGSARRRRTDESRGFVARFVGTGGGGTDEDEEARGAIDWSSVEFDPTPFLGFHPDGTESRLAGASDRAEAVWATFRTAMANTPVVKDEYGWEQFKWEYYYEPDGSLPRDGDGRIEAFDSASYLGFDPAAVEDVLARGGGAAADLAALVDERTVDVNPDLDEDAFFSTADGHTTMVNRYDLEKAVTLEKKRHFDEVERYWVDKPRAFVVIFHSTKENEKKYYLVDPYLDEIEEEVRRYIAGKLRTAIRYADDDVVLEASDEDRRAVIEEEVRRLLARYDVYDGSASADGDRLADRLPDLLSLEGSPRGAGDGGLEGIEARPEPVVLAENPDTLSEYQAEKLLYRLKRDFLGYERIDGIKHDIQVEDISCDGYNSPVFVYHTEYEQLITNVRHGESQLDNFVIKLAQRSGKGISKRRPQVDATLPDGSRAQLTLGREVSDHGTNYTIRQFNDVPFTPVDLVNWNTFSLDEMAFLWLCIESEKSIMFGGGTASGKTTSLNAVSLFIPSNSKIVSIEDTREVELPQRNWVASVTRPSFTDDDTGDVDEFDLLEAGLRQRPEYIVMGEIRGEEGRTLFQVMSTGHTTLTTFHADSVDEVIKRFTTDPINVSKTMFTALDLVSIQTQTRVDGRKVRRNSVLTDINYYDTENDEINVQDVYQWQPESDEFLHLSESNRLDDIAFDRGWDRDRLDDELFKRRVVLAYLIDRGLNTYAEVAATVQAFINDPDTILTLMAREELEARLEDLREMESVLIDVNPEKEALVPRPDPAPETAALAERILDEAEERLFDDYENRQPSALVSALPAADEAPSVVVEPGSGDREHRQPDGDDPTGDPDGDDPTGDPDGGPTSGDAAGGDAASGEDASRNDTSGDDASEGDTSGDDASEDDTTDSTAPADAADGDTDLDEPE